MGEDVERPNGLGEPTFRHNAVLMVTGTVLSQGLIFAAMPVLARIYSPEAIGLQALFVSVAGTLGVLASLRLDLASVLPSREQVAAQLGALVTLQGLVLGALVEVAVALWGDELFQLLSPDAHSTLWLWLLGPMVTLNTFASGLLGLATRWGRFATIALGNLGLSGVFVVVACGLGFVGSPESGPVWARFAGQAGAALFLVVALRVSWLHLASLGSVRRVAELWRDYRPFLIFNTPYSVISVLTRDLPLYIFSVAGTIGVTAAYAMARAVTLAPTVLISSAMSRVMYREAALRLGTPELERLAHGLTRAGLWLSLPGFGFLLVWGDRLFEILLGPPWTTAGEFSQRLAIPLWIAIQTGWPERLFEAAGRQRRSFIIQLSFDALHAIAMIVCFWVTRDPVLTVSVYAVSLTVYHLTYLAAVYGVAGFARRPLARVLTGAVGGFGVVVVGHLALRLTLGTAAPGLILGGLLTFVLTCAAALVLRPRQSDKVAGRSRAGTGGGVT